MYACSALGHPPKKLATIEHVVPRKYGGTDGTGNMKMSCYRCNQNRGTIAFDLFLDLVRKTPYNDVPKEARKLRMK